MTQPVDQQRRYTVEEYFELEEHSDEKHEYWDGLLLPLRGPLAMSGGSVEHAVITANVIGAFRDRVAGGPCRVASSDLRVNLHRSTQYVYPDASVTCGPPRFDPKDKRHGTILNPRLLIEVLSPSTQAIDRNEKLRDYLQIPTVEEYLMISQAQPRVEGFFRQPAGAWLFTPVEGLELNLTVRSLGFEVPLREIFGGIEFPPNLFEIETE